MARNILICWKTITFGTVKRTGVYKHVRRLQTASLTQFCMYSCLNGGLRGAPGYSLDQAHHLPIEMDSLVGE